MKDKKNNWNPLRGLTYYWGKLIGKDKSVASSMVRKKKSTVGAGHGNVSLKQIITPESPAKEEQRKFIDEGGNSQPLKND